MRIKSSYQSLSNFSPYLACSLLFGTLISLLLPVLPSVSAAAPTSGLSDQTAMGFSTTVLPAISVATESKVDLNVIPSATGSFTTTTTQVMVATNSREGYSLFLEAVGETNALKPINKDNLDTITSITGNTTENNFPANSWGFTIAGPGTTDMGYQPIPITATDAIASSAAPNQNDSYDLTFAVKVDTSLTTDTYSGAVLISAVANPTTARNLSELVYMQSMTSEICENTMDYVDRDNYIAKQLIDIRDGKPYQVAKLADGNCWMTENLELVFKDSSNGIIAATADGSNGTKLTSDNTDITVESWAPSTASRTTASATVNGQAIAWYFDTGNADIGYQAYYTWGLATVGSSPTEGAITPSSICPKGWKLPLAGESYNTTSGSFYNLLNAYGFTSKVSSVAGEYTVYQPDKTTKTYAVVDGQYSITEEPLKFVYSGELSTSGFAGAGANGYLWSSVRANTSTAYRLGFSAPTNVYPSYNNAHAFGFPVRCLAR